jgi:DnaJ-class molecular chaperone
MVAFNMLNYYEILEVEVDSTTAEIKAAYRKLARKYHPDINKEVGAIDKFKMITLAYETLSNDQEREKYNILKGIFRKPESEKTTTSGAKASEEYQNTAKAHKEANEEDKKTYTQEPKRDTSGKKAEVKKREFNLLKTIKYFVTKFKKNKRAKDNKKPQKGQNITTDVTITPEEVITGSKRVINVLTTQTCTVCGGHRFINGGKCPECGGSGEVSRRKKITVTIPKGIKDGAKLRLKGEGGAGKNGAPSGDLFIIVRIQAPTKVQFDKQNIYYNVPITPFEAVLGEEIRVPTFDGTIKLKLPKNTTSGQKFRLAGQGIKKGGKVGDLIITVSIEISHDLSDDEIELYEKLKNLSKDDVRKNLMNEG